VAPAGDGRFIREDGKEISDFLLDGSLDAYDVFRDEVCPARCPFCETPFLPNRLRTFFSPTLLQFFDIVMLPKPSRISAPSARTDVA
jgi:hypothetical protein